MAWARVALGGAWLCWGLAGSGRVSGQLSRGRGRAWGQGVCPVIPTVIQDSAARASCPAPVTHLASPPLGHVTWRSSPSRSASVLPSQRDRQGCLLRRWRRKGLMKCCRRALHELAGRVLQHGGQVKESTAPGGGGLAPGAAFPALLGHLRLAEAWLTPRAAVAVSSSGSRSPCRHLASPLVSIVLGQHSVLPP